MSEKFIFNKYFRWYLTLIAKNDEGHYIERHHIIPRSMKGKNNESNIVKLTYRKHFLAHWLLTKCTEGENKRKMFRALYRMTHDRYGNRIISSWQYAIARKACAIAMSMSQKGKPKSQAQKEKQRLSMTGRIGVDSAETREKKARAWRGRKHKPETKKKMSESGKGPKSPSHIEAIRDAVKRRPSRKGTTLSQEIKDKMAHARWITDGVKVRRLTADENEPPEGWYYGRPTMNGNPQAKLGNLASVAKRAKLKAQLS